MEQDEHRELEGAMPASGTPEEEPGKTAVQEGRETTRRNILHLLAGGYLLYLAWQLGSGFVSGIGENGWNGSMVMVSCIRRMLAKQHGDQDKKED